MNMSNRRRVKRLANLLDRWATALRAYERRQAPKRPPRKNGQAETA